MAQNTTANQRKLCRFGGVLKGSSRVSEGLLTSLAYLNNMDWEYESLDTWLRYTAHDLVRLINEGEALIQEMHCEFPIIYAEDKIYDLTQLVNKISRDYEEW